MFFQERYAWGPELPSTVDADLSPLVRAKAIEVPNALLAQGYDEGRSIRIGIAEAKRWANHEMPETPNRRQQIVGNNS